MSTDKFGTFSQVILCDDIRMENNGKYLIVGMFTSDILVSDLPAFLQLRLLVAYTREVVGSQQLDFVWSLDDEILAEMEGRVDQQILGAPVIMALPAVPIRFEREGRLRVQARLASGETAELLNRRLAKSDTPIPFI